MNKNWTYKKLGEIATFSRGLTFSKADVTDVSSKKVLRSNNIDLNNHSLNYDDVACLNETFVIPDEKKLHKGDIFICMSNGSTQHLGKVAFVEADIEYAFGGFMGAIHPNVKFVYPKYVFYSCLSTEYRSFLASVLNGVNINNLKWSELSNFPIPIPPHETQSCIVSELDLLQSIIDKQKAQQIELDSLTQAIFYDMFGDPVENEKDWIKKRFSEVFRFKSGDGLSGKNFSGGKIPVFGGNGISGYHNEFNKTGKHIIIGRVGAYCGNVRFVHGDFWLTDNAFDAFFNAEELDYWFTCYLLNTIDLHRYANHAAQPVISNVVLKDIQVILPPLSLQQSFATKIESIEKQKAAISKSIEETQKLFDYSMDKYFG